MNGYITTKQATEKWGITQRQVQIHCQKGRIPGITKFNNNYMIPENAQRPMYDYFSKTEDKKD